MDNETRGTLCDVIEMLIALLDRLDSDADLEDDGCGEPDVDKDIANAISDYDRVPPKHVA